MLREAIELRPSLTFSLKHDTGNRATAIEYWTVAFACREVPSGL